MKASYPQEDGWRVWTGDPTTSGPLPDKNAMVEVVLLSGKKFSTPCGVMDWRLSGNPADIMVYRLVQNTPEPLTYSAPGILHKAAEIMEERGKQYDQPGGERSMGKAVAAFNIISGRDLQESEGWLLLQVLKDVRDRQKKVAHTDSLEDCVAYSALKAESRLAGR